MIEQRLVLDYRLTADWLMPWADALRAGKALGRRCLACGRVSFPPELTCRCATSAGEWIELSGRADVVEMTEGPDGHIALVQFEGADMMAVARVRARTTFRRGLALLPSEGSVPQMIVGHGDEKD